MAVHSCFTLTCQSPTGSILTAALPPTTPLTHGRQSRQAQLHKTVPPHHPDKWLSLPPSFPPDTLSLWAQCHWTSNFSPSPSLTPSLCRDKPVSCEVEWPLWLPRRSGIAVCVCVCWLPLMYPEGQIGHNPMLGTKAFISGKLHQVLLCGRKSVLCCVQGVMDHDCLCSRQNIAMPLLNHDCQGGIPVSCCCVVCPHLESDVMLCHCQLY